MMTAILALQDNQDDSRDLYLYDTYEGMPEPTEADKDWFGNPAAWEKAAVEKTTSTPWLYASVEDVRGNLGRLGYPSEKLHFIQGKVEDTIPTEAPDQIALLRLDTDFYESTLHELKILLPRLSRNGVLIVDDYGHWQGSKQAVDEYLSEWSRPILLTRIDYSARMAVVP